MAAIFARAVLAPLKICPESISKVQLLLSPSLSNGGSGHANSNGHIPKENSNGHLETQGPQPPFLPVSCLPSLVKECSSLVGPLASYTPSPHLPSGHLQTIYSASADTVEQDKVMYKRRVIMVPDGGIISLDIAERDEDEGKDRETIVFLHGLTGGSQESYVRHCAKRILEGPGYRCVIVNFRGCANTPITSPQLYSASKTSDFRCALLFLTSIYPHSPLVGLSFSLGANVMAKYLGEEGDATPLIGGICCAAPFHLKRGGMLLEGSTLRRNVYSRAMNANLTRVTRRHAATLDLDERLRDALDDLLDSHRAQVRAKQRGEKVAYSKDTLKYVDDTLVRLIGGHRKPYGEFPFESAEEYYSHGGALLTLKGLKRPLLALNADDDPIVAKESVAGIKHLMGWHDANEEEEYGHTEYIVLATTGGGGHLGYWEGYKRPSRWVHRPVIDFSKAIFEESKKLMIGDSQHTTYDKHATTTKEVLIELMPLQMLPSYVEVKNRDASKEKVNETLIDKQDERYTKGPRLPWLRTKLLEEAVLVHPSMSRFGWCGEKPASVAKFSMSKQGDVIDAENGVEKGWCAFKTEMTCDTIRPEVGFVELPPWTRVAGSGEYFQGGKDTPGLYGEDAAASDGTIAGL